MPARKAGQFVTGPKSVRYYPFPGNEYHELAFVRTDSGNSLEMIAIKDRGNRVESIYVQPEDVSQLCEHMCKIAHVKPAETAAVQELAAAIVAALDIPYPADSALYARRDRIIAGRTAGIVGALEELARGKRPGQGRTLSECLAVTAGIIRAHCINPAVDYKIESNPDDGTPA